jgi:adenosylmethionine-8-amino-7-oxononanoate aminotransferase
VAGGGGFHVGHTHKAHPLACAVGLAVLDETVQHNLIGRAQDSGAYLRDRLTGLQTRSAIIGDVRGIGMLNAVEIVADRDSKAMLPRELDVIGRIQALARDQGLLIYGRRTHAGRFGDWIMVSPPLIATRDDIDEIVAGLGQCINAYQQELSLRP